MQQNDPKAVLVRLKIDASPYPNLEDWKVKKWTKHSGPFGILILNCNPQLVIHAQPSQFWKVTWCQVIIYDSVTILGMFLKDRIDQTTSQASPLFQCAASFAGCEGVGDGGYAALAKKLPQTLPLSFKWRGTCCGQLLYRRNGTWTFSKMCFFFKWGIFTSKTD